MEKNYLGSEIKKLGFGLMRLPMLGENVDLEQTKKMVDEFMSKGFTYFDTAYVYINGKSEVAAKETIVDRYPRESFQLATKLPIWAVNNEEDMERVFQEHLDRTGAGYFDFYLLHALNADTAKKCDEIGAWDFIAKKKSEGKIKHIGFSFHDTADVLDTILEKHPESEFVQLQINYADWEDEGVQSKKCYETAMKYNCPVIIMEPVKGGSLANMTEDVQALYKNVNPDMSIASWAVRYAASLEGVVTVLSGMSTYEQLEDNLSYMEDFKPITEDEAKTIDKAVEILRSIPTIPCTACAYCVDDCPQKINIPGFFKAYNTYTAYNNLVSAKNDYGYEKGEGGDASSCIACGACEGHCPQKIAIIDTLKKVAETLE